MTKKRISGHLPISFGKALIVSNIPLCGKKKPKVEIILELEKTFRPYQVHIYIRIDFIALWNLNDIFI